MDLRVQLPAPVAAEVAAVQRQNPELLSQLLFYAMTRRTIFHHLASQSSEVGLPK